MIKFLSGSNQIIDTFSFSIYKNQGICSLEIVGSIHTKVYTEGWATVSTIKIREQIYALLAENFNGLKIIKVSNP